MRGREIRSRIRRRGKRNTTRPVLVLSATSSKPFLFIIIDRVGIRENVFFVMSYRDIFFFTLADIKSRTLFSRIPFLRLYCSTSAESATSITPLLYPSHLLVTFLITGRHPLLHSHFLLYISPVFSSLFLFSRPNVIAIHSRSLARVTRKISFICTFVSCRIIHFPLVRASTNHFFHDTRLLCTRSLCVVGV